MNPIPSVCEEQKEELEKELELQRQRLMDATHKASEKLKQSVAVETWIKEYPVPTAVLMALGGFVAAHLFYQQDT